MRFLKWFLGIVAALILVVAIGGYFFLKNFDLNKYKAYAENIVLEKTGRKLAINGDASLGISLIPTLIINDISFSNPDWAKNPEMIKLKSLELQMSILPLLKKQVVIDKAVLNAPEVYLETSADGKNSWEIEIKHSEPKQALGGFIIGTAHADEIADSRAEILKKLSDFTAREVSIGNGLVNYYKHQDKSNMLLKINSLTLSADSIHSPVLLAWDMDFNKMLSTGNATLGAIAALFDKNTSYPVDIETTTLNIKANLKAKILDILGDNLGVEFNLDAHNPAGNLSAPETSILASGTGNLKNIDLNIEKIDVAKNIITGTINADISGKLPYAKINLASDLINVPTLTPPAKKASFNLISSAHASELVPDEVIAFALLNLANLDAKVSVKKLIISESMSAQNVSLNAKLNNGNLNIAPLTLNFGHGTITANAMINAAAHSLNLKLDSNGILLQDLHKEFTIESNNDFGFLSGGKTMINADLTGTGKTYRELVNNLNGPFVAVVEPSELQSGNLHYFTDDLLAQILSAVHIDAEKQKKITLKCAVVHADFKDQKANFPKGIAVDSDRLTLISSGTISLPNDKLDLSLNAYSNKIANTGVTQALTNLFKIGGTLKSPRLSIDTKGALKTAVSVAATGGVALGADMVLNRDPSPCYTAVQGTKYSTYFPKPTGVVSATQNIYQGTADAVGNLLSGNADALKQNAKDALKGFLK